ncbi:SDR family NAD(P)-dependent oxidoreductase [Deinococcus sp.]|uniref:SDR family NAD(P)-dependent oxidoreductase n=1 Tax=Deinococcus sp. TaxID=47478 RepID=UPI003CC6893F
MPRIITPFHAQSTAAEVIAGLDLSDKRVMVTGAASGIGVETARSLAAAGAEVTLAVRNIEAGNRVAADIRQTTGSSQVRVESLELNDRASIQALVQRWDGPLHILVNNAGVMALPETRTPEGWELQFATNHLGHFALTLGLLDALAAARSGRVVSVSSAGHLRSPVVFDDIHFQRRPYDPFLAYGQSKTANILFAVEASKRWADLGITVNALMPGAIRTAGVAKLQISAEQMAQLEATGTDENARFWKSPEQGAATSVLLAASPLLAGISGRYFEDGNEAEAHVPGIQRGVTAYALDPEAAKRLWNVSLRLLA